MATGPTRDPAGEPAGPSWDECLVRLEDALGSFPFDRALPDLHTLLEAADVSEEFVREDERALKVLHEAVVARPLSSVDAVARVRTEVELLTLEVEILTDRLEDPASSEETLVRSRARLQAVRDELDHVRRQL